MKKKVLVVGAGFRGFCDSLQLINAGHTVHLIDSAPFFGGISYSLKFKEFFVDKGVHMMNSVPQEFADIVSEIMNGQVRTIDFISVSAFNKTLTDGFALPDLSSLDETTKNTITQELLTLAEKNAQGAIHPDSKTLLELLESRYGKTAGGIFGDIFKHIYHADAHLVQPDAISKTSLGRLKYLDDDAMLKMKQRDPWLDDMLAARRKSIGKVDDLVSVYPNSGEAMRGWCDRAKAWLEAKGVIMHLGERIQSIQSESNGVTIKTETSTIEGDSVVWTNDNVDALARAVNIDFSVASYISGTPMLFATFVTQAKHIKNFTYLQNFDPSGHTYRSASAGIYSNQITPDGTSFVTCECPAEMGSDRWEKGEALYQEIWQECKDLSVVDANAELLDHQILKFPSTFKVARLGYDEKIFEFNALLAKKHDRIIFRDVKPFFRTDMYRDSFNVPAMVA